MSEFSASFHLRTDDADDAVALLRRAKVAGFVYDAESGWSAIAHAEGSDDALVAANTGVLLQFEHAADHGCSVRAYHATSCVARLAVDFERSERRFDRAAFVAAKLLGVRASKALEKDLRGGAGSSVRDAIAGAFGLTRFKWLSYHYASTGDAPVAGRRHVSADGRLAEPEHEADLAAVLHPTRARVARPQPRRAISEEAREGLEALADLDALLRDRERVPTTKK
jgi:hypothetical protein